MNELARDRSDPFREEPSEVVEVPLLMSLDQIAALEKAAHREGLTAAGLVRRLLGDFIRGKAALRAC
ncbi:MAG: hypothetical protein K2W96_19115 [Gemmataceae bacterium]|nr:hypothetical protein [Gemmataceae bacterium]